MIRGKGVANPSFRQRTAYHAMLLGGMAMITSALIVIGDKETHAAIELRKAEDMKKSLSQVIPPEIHGNDLLKDVVDLKIGNETKKFYIARDDGRAVAAAFEITAFGYAGPINVMVGINQKGELLGARVLSHNETPGLGDKIEAGKSRWIFAFTGLSLTNPGEAQWKVKKDGGRFDQFSGATITPRGVVKAIKQSLEIFRDYKGVLLANESGEKKTSQQPSQHSPDDSPKSQIPRKPKAANDSVTGITNTKDMKNTTPDNSPDATQRG